MATRAESFDERIAHSFTEEWPELARRLERFLAAKGVEVWLRGDVVQETATRVYRKWPSLDHARPLWNLVVTIALGVLVDERRKTSRVELFSDVPQSDVDDVETRALHRVHIAKTRAALNKLRADQRRVLLAEIGEAAMLDGSRNRINVVRLRARLALKGELGPWAPAGVALRLRSLRTAIQRRVADWMADWGPNSHGLATSLASLAAAATLVLSGAGLDGASAAPNSQDRELLSGDDLRDAGLYLATLDTARDHASRLRSATTRGSGAERLPEHSHCCLDDFGGIAKDTERAVAEERRRTDKAVRDEVNRSREEVNGARDEANEIREEETRRANKERKWAEREKDWAEDQLP